MPIKDYSKFYKHSTHTANHAPFFPKNIFCVISGRTGCEKTNLMQNLLFENGYLNYGSIYLYSSTLHQPAYQYIKERLTKIENDIYAVLKKQVEIGHYFDTDEEIIDPKELDPKINHIIIFDDVMLKDQTKIKEYFCRGRHNNVNVFYLCQSLHKIAKHCIRENANMFILFKQDDKTLKYFHETHISGDMDFKEFKSFSDGAWSEKHGFIVINLWDDTQFGRYWANYKNVYTPSKYEKLD